MKNPDLCKAFLIVVIETKQTKQNMRCYQGRIVGRFEFDLLTSLTRVRIPTDSQAERECFVQDHYPVFYLIISEYLEFCKMLQTCVELCEKRCV